MSAPVNKVSRNNRTRSEQNGGKVTTRTTSTEQRSLGKDRVCLPRCARLTSQYNKVTPLIMLNGAGFHTRCLYWVTKQPSPRNNYSPSPPMKLITSQSLPPSSASSATIMSHSIALAGLAHRKHFLTLHCFLTWNSNQSEKISPPCPPDFETKQVSHPRTDRSGPGLSADT